MSRQLTKNQAPVFDPKLVWQQIILLDCHFDGFMLDALVDMMMSITHVNMKSKITHYVGELKFSGILSEGAYGWLSLKRYSDYAPPLTGLTLDTRTAYQALWTALRSLKAVTPVDLARAASTDEQGVSPQSAKAFLATLKTADYVKENAKRYSLMPHKNTGPRAPILRLRDGIVYDVNLMKPVINLNEKSRRAA